MCEYLKSDIRFFFDKHMDAFPLYEYFEEQVIKRIPNTKIKVSKSQIGFSLKYGYAFVSFNSCRKAKDRPNVWMTITFGLSYRKESPRIDAAIEAYPNRWTHHVMVGSKDDIDEELFVWVQEAADFSVYKSR